MNRSCQTKGGRASPTVLIPAPRGCGEAGTIPPFRARPAERLAAGGLAGEAGLDLSLGHVGTHKMVSGKSLCVLKKNGSEDLEVSF